MKCTLDETLINESFDIPLILRDGPDGARHYGIVRMPQKFSNEGFGSRVCPTAQIVNRFRANFQIWILQALADSRLPVRS